MEGKIFFAYTLKNLTRLFLVVSSIFLSPVLTEAAAVNWNSSDWTLYDTITVDSSNVSEDLIDFPVYVDLADLSAQFWSNTPSATSTVATDIRVTTNDESPIELPRELVTASSTLQTGELHFKADVISSTTDSVFRIYYNGTTTGDYASTSVYGSQGVWGNGYLLVYHMESINPSDSTFYTKTGTATGDGLVTGPGKIGNLAVDITDNTGDDYIDIGDYLSELDGLGNVTISAWVNIDEDSSDDWIFSRGRTSTNQIMLWDNISGSAGNDTYTFNYGLTSAAANRIDGQTGDAVGGQWQYVVATMDGDGRAIYTDGSLRRSGTGGGSTIAAGNSNAAIGDWDSSSADFGGSIDEFRIATTTRTTGWIFAEHLNQSTTTDFYTVSANSVDEGVGTYTLSGTLFDVAGAPITSGMVVSAGVATSTPSIHSTTTDASGNFFISDIATSTIGDWSTTTAAGDDDTWQTLTYGNGMFVALGYAGDTRVMTSVDGVTWVAGSTGSVSGTWLDVVYGNGLFVAVGNLGDRVMTSPDGITWTARSAAGDDDAWQSVTYADGLFVAVGSSGDRVMTSPDGITWTARSAAGDDDAWRSVTHGNGLFVAVGITGDRVMTSPDGITWTARSAAGDNDDWFEVVYGNGLFVAVGESGDRVMTSPDGITWTARSAAGDDDAWRSLVYANGSFVAAAYGGSEILMTSPDGITWTARSAAGDDDAWRSLEYGSGRFVAVSSSGDRAMYADAGFGESTPITLYLDGEVSKATTITYGTNGTSVEGLVLQVGVTTVQHASTSGSVDLADADFYDYDDDANILFDSDTATTSIGSSATTSHFAVASNTTLYAPQNLEIYGNLTQNGSFQNEDGVLYFSGNSAYSLAHYNYVTSKSLGFVEPTPFGIEFNDDGTKLYTVGATNESVDEWNVVVPYSMAVVNHVDALSVVSQPTDPSDIEFSDDGTRLFVIGSNGASSGRITQWDLSVAWDVSTGVFDDLLLVNSQESLPRGLAFNSDGTKLYVVGSAGGGVDEWSLSSAWDVASATYVDTLDVSSRVRDPQDVEFNSDGTELYVSGFQRDPIVTAWSLAVPYDVSGGVYDRELYIGDDVVSPRGFEFSEDGKQLFFVGSESNDVHEVELSAVHSGFLSGDNALGAVEITKGQVFANSASTSDLTINSDSTLKTPSTTLEIAGNYTNNGSFHANSGNIVFSSASGTVNGNQVGSNAFHDLTVTGVYTANSETAVTGDYVILGTFDRNGYQMQTLNTINNTSVLNDSLDVQVQEDSVFGMAFNNDGTKLYVVGVADSAVDEWSLSTAYDVSTGVYVDTLDVSAQESTPTGLAFNNDGTKLYVIGYTGDAVDEWSLSTAYDVSTGVYVDTLDVSAQETLPTGLAFNNDGTKLYVVGIANDSLDEWSLSTAYDVSTGVYVDTLDVSAQEGLPIGFSFNSKGTELFVSGQNSDAVHRWVLSSPYKVSTATFADSFSIFDVETLPGDVALNSDDTKMYVVGTGGDSIFEWSLNSLTITGATATSAFDDLLIDGGRPVLLGSNASATNVTVNVGGQLDTDAHALSVDGDFINSSIFTNETGSLLLTGVSKTASGTLTTLGDTTIAGSITFEDTATTSNLTINSSGSLVAPATMSVDGSFTQSGSFDSNGGTVYFGGGVEFDVTGASYADSFDVSAYESSPYDVVFNASGTRMYVTGISGLDTVDEYALGVAWDVSTASYTDGLTVNIDPRSIAFNASGTKIYVLDASNDLIEEYSLSVAWDVSTGSYVDSLSITTQESLPRDIAFSEDGTILYVIGLGGSEIDEWSLSVAWDVSTGSYVDSLDVSAPGSGTIAFSFNDVGTKLYVVNLANDAISVWSLGAAWDVSTGEYESEISVRSENDYPTSIAFNASGTKMYLVENNISGSKEVEEWSLYATHAGNFVGMNKFTDVVLKNGVHILNNSASTTDLTISASSTLDLQSVRLSLVGDYTNSGTFTASTSEVVFNGAAQQTATGSMDGTSQFYDLTVANVSQDGSTNQSVVFGSNVTATGTYAMAASTSAAFTAGATSAFNNVDLQGTSVSPVYLRSTSPGNEWYTIVDGSQIQVTYVDVSDSDASGGDEIVAATSTNSGNNTNWDFGYGNEWSSTYWTEYDLITIDSQFVSDYLYDFPIYVDLSDLSAAFWSTIVDGGGDIRVTTDEVNPTEVPREVVYASIGSESGELHFKAPYLNKDGDTSFRIYYNGTDVDYNPDQMYGAQNVWTNDFVGVWHLGEGYSTAIDFYQDSTNHEAHGTLTDIDVDSVAATGLLGGAIDFNGDADLIGVTNAATTTDSFTVSVWAKPYQTHQIDTESTSGTSGTAGQNYLIGPVDGGANAGSGLSFGTNGVSVYEHGTSYMPATLVYVPGTDADWQYIAVAYKNKQPSIYKNGTLADTGLTSPRGSVHATVDGLFEIGGSQYGFHDGEVDEVRVASTTRTSAWINATYKNQSDPASFYSLKTGVGSSTISDHVATQVSNAFTFQNQNDEVLFAFKLKPESGNATVTRLRFDLSGARNISVADFSDIRLFVDVNDNASFDGGSDTVQVGGSGVMTPNGQLGNITFETDFLVTAEENYILVADWDAPERASQLSIDLRTSGVFMIDDAGAVEVFGSVDGVQHHRTNKGGGGSVISIGTSPPPGNGTTTGGTNDGGELIGDSPDFYWPTSNSGDWTNGANVYDQIDGTYATATGRSSQEMALSNMSHGVPGTDQIIGIEVKIEWNTVSQSGVTIDLSYDGGTTYTTGTGVGVKTILLPEQSGDVVHVLGSPTDTWGRSWSASELSDANFRVRLRPDGTFTNDVLVDAIQVKIYHQSSGGGSGGGGAI